jgi:hydroxyethylthiazole kinase
MGPYENLAKVRQQKPLIHHLTNWVTIYDCANILKVFGASPVMAHAKEEAAQMSSFANALVLNIGTLTVDFVESMKLAAEAANLKKIPVIIDVCGAGATKLRNDKCFELLDSVKMDVIKGNASEVAFIAGEAVKTKGVDSGKVDKDLTAIAIKLAKKRNAVVVITGKVDIVSDGKKTYLVSNGCEMMSHVVGTGCMAASVIGGFCAVNNDLADACVNGLVCYEIAAQLAAKKSKGPGTFKEKLFDFAYSLTAGQIKKYQKIRLL